MTVLADMFTPPSNYSLNYLVDSFVLYHSVRLTSEEVRLYLESQGAEDAKVIDVNGDFGEFKQMVIASGRSVRHIRKMTQSIVTAVGQFYLVPFFVISTFSSHI